MRPRPILYWATIVLPLLFTRCAKEEAKPQQLLVNGNFENGNTVPTDWGYITEKDIYNGEWSDKEFVSPCKSAKISSLKSDSTVFSFWYQTITDNLPFGKDVTLKVKIKGNMSGKAISIASRTDDTTIPTGRVEQFITTENLSPITGSFNWSERIITLSNVKPTSKSIIVYFINLPNTTGEVYFDNASLTYLTQI
jgi:hypothetical protein